MLFFSLIVASISHSTKPKGQQKKDNKTKRTTKKGQQKKGKTKRQKKQTINNIRIRIGYQKGNLQQPCKQLHGFNFANNR